MLRILVSLLIFIISSWSYATESGERLVVANSKAWKPFSFINQNGEPDGILIDYWREYGHKNNVEIEFMLLDWQDSLDAVRDGKADIHAGLLWSEQRESYLDYAPSLLTIDTQIYINQKLIGTNLDNFMQGNHEHSIGIVAGAYEEEFVSRHFPNLDLVTYSNNQSMLDAAFRGELDAFAADLQVANFYLYSSKEPQRFVGVRHLYSGDLRAAVREGNDLLQQQITNGINAFGNEEKKKVFSRWMYVSTVYPDYLLPAALLVIGVGAFSYIVALNITVKRRTQALERANLKLRKLSETDQLTQLSNRRHFVSEFQRRLQARGSLAIMIFDIDDFKQVNDEHGHQLGDEVIKSVAEAARGAVSHKHLLGRIGGEEFAVVVSGESYKNCVNIAESICTVIRSLTLLEDHQTKVTVSLGCAYYVKANKDQSLSDADHLMYQSKMNGKDCVTTKAFE